MAVQRAPTAGHVGPQKIFFLISPFSITIQSSQAWFSIKVSYIFLYHFLDRLFIYVKKWSHDGQKLKKRSNVPHSLLLHHYTIEPQISCFVAGVKRQRLSNLPSWVLNASFEGLKGKFPVFLFVTKVEQDYLHFW